MHRPWLRFLGPLVLLAATCGPASAQFQSLSGVIPPSGGNENDPYLPTFCRSNAGALFACPAKPGSASYAAEPGIAGFRFSGVGSQGLRWFDPAADLGFRIEVPNVSFSAVVSPSFYGLMLYAGSTWLPLPAGSTTTAVQGLNSFDVYGLGGDVQSGYFPTALPPTLTIGIRFSGVPTYMDWTYITSAVPEAGTLATLTAGLGVLCLLRRRASAQRARPPHRAG